MAVYEKKEKGAVASAESDGTVKSSTSSSISNINKKARYLSWTFVLYPDSCPKNWLDIIREELVPFAVSPLHDRDKTELGEPKKPHYHILLSFRSVKTFEQIKEITDKLNQPIPQSCKDTRGLVRYFLHLDHPNKAQYERKDIISGGGFDIENALQATATEEEEILDTICDFLEENWITEFAAANSWIRHNKKEWRLIFRKNTTYFREIIRSQRHMVKNEKK